MIFAIVTTGLVTVYAQILHLMGLSPDASLRDGDVRTAIALSMTLMYLTLVGYGVFVADKSMGALATSLINSFTSLVGVVIAFYFGASAYVEAKRAAAGTDQATVESRQVGQLSLGGTTAKQPNSDSVTQAAA
jgi:hypothetical protein